MTKTGNSFPSAGDLDKELARFKEEKDSVRTEVLIVLGVHLLKRSLRKLLQPHYTLLETDNAETALTILGKQKPQLVFVDNNPPDSTGINLVRRMRQRNNNTPVIMAFNTVSEGDLQKISELKVADYFTHPFNADMLLVTIQNILKKAQASIRFDEVR